MRKNMKLIVKKAENLSEDCFESLVDTTAETFLDDPSFAFLFSSPRHMKKFISVCMKYYYQSGQMFICESGDGKIYGMSCWVDSTGEKMGRHTMKKYGISNEFRRVLMSLSPRSIFRVIRLASLTDKSHIKEPHAYLVLLASFQKGTGGIMIEDYISSHPSETLYLENSNIDKNTGFYTKYGFEPLKEIKYGSLHILTMIKNGK